MKELYNIENIEGLEGKLSAVINLNKNHKVFCGHFPERSVLPGVIELEIIKKVLAVHLQKSLRLKSVKNAKYLAMILPEENISFTVLLDYEFLKETIKVKAVLKDVNNVYLKFSGVFGENEYK